MPEQKGIEAMVQQAVEKHFTLPQYLSSEQCCEYLHISKETLYKYVAKRQIPFHKVYRKLLFSRVELEQFITEKSIK